MRDKIFFVFLKNVKIFKGLTKILTSLTGWSSARSAYLLLVGSVIVDMIGYFNELPENQVGLNFQILSVVIHIWFMSCCICEPIHKISKSLGGDTLGISLKEFESLVFSSLLIYVLMLSNFFLIPSDTTIVLVMGIWERVLDLGTLCVAWNFTPPGKSLLSRVKEKLNDFAPDPVGVGN